LPKISHFAPPKIFGLATPLGRNQNSDNFYKRFPSHLTKVFPNFPCIGIGRQCLGSWKLPILEQKTSEHANVSKFASEFLIF